MNLETESNPPIQALVIAHEESADSRKHQITQATKSVLFLGTPHRGSNFALLGMMVSYLSYWRGSRTDLLEFLTPSSRELEDLCLSFSKAFESARIVNFFENRPITIRGIPLYFVCPTLDVVVAWPHCLILLYSRHQPCIKQLFT